MMNIISESLILLRLCITEKLTTSEKLLWQFIYCNNNLGFCCYNIVAQRIHISEEEVESGLNKLVKLKLISDNTKSNNHNRGCVILYGDCCNKTSNDTFYTFSVEKKHIRNLLKIT